MELDVEPVSKLGRSSEQPRAVLSIKDEEGPAEPITLACQSKTVQFANHMILGSRIELLEIEELPKRLIWEVAGRAFRLQASAIMAAECAKKTYEDGCAKEALERQVKAFEAKLSEMMATLDATIKATRDAKEIEGAMDAAS
ncbi:unnamed protein product [Prunus armeniaca]